MNVRPTIATASAMLAVLLAGGCSSLYEPKPAVSKLDHQEVLSHTASVKNTFVFERNSPLIFCAEPPPDAAFTQTTDMDFNFALFGSATSGDSGGEREQSAEMAMDGRVPPIMLARELLYRLCEFSKNHQIDTETAVDLYQQNLDIIRGVADTTAENTTIKIGETLTTTEMESLDEAVPGIAGNTDATDALPAGDKKRLEALDSQCEDDDFKDDNEDLCGS